MKNKNQNENTNINFYKLVFVLLLIITILSCFYIIRYFYDMHISKSQSKLLNEVNITEDDNIILSNVSLEDSEEKKKMERMLKLEELRKENDDIVGWVEIENTDINYPVLQANDNSFYMNHNYKGGWSQAGSIFLDKDYDFNLPSDNLLIYGHNMKNSTMFQNLLKYNSKDFYNEHPIIRFTSTAEDAEYEIFSAFYSKVYYETDKNVFRYYNFVNSNSEEEYNNFVNNTKKYSLYDTGITPNYKESLITLSTCSYHTEDGRFVVVGRKKVEHQP